jgi:quercetin dioxygenase-like cupin family protein
MNRMTSLQKLGTLLAVAGISLSMPIITSATPGVGTLFNIVLNRATVADPIHTGGHFGNWNAVLQTNEPTDFIVQNVALAPGGYSGWHRHLGPVLITVKRGTATMYRADPGGCSVFVYPAGSAFVEPVGPHTLQNESETEVLELFNAHIIPAGAPQRVDEANPGVCPGVE